MPNNYLMYKLTSFFIAEDRSPRAFRFGLSVNLISVIPRFSERVVFILKHADIQPAEPPYLLHPWTGSVLGVVVVEFLSLGERVLWATTPFLLILFIRWVILYFRGRLSGSSLSLMWGALVATGGICVTINIADYYPAPSLFLVGALAFAPIGAMAGYIVFRVGRRVRAM
jgi:hypothetical protein